MYPIIFNSEMVRTILDGRKTQTRRIIKPQPQYDRGYWSYEYKKGCHHYIGDTHPTEHWSLENMLPYCPYGTVGSKLWVRETWQGFNKLSGSVLTNGIPKVNYGEGFWAAYKADNIADPKCKWRPSIHMPRWACRIFLGITAIRVERVQDITPENCEKEGLELTRHSNLQMGRYERICQDFGYLWDSINLKRAPWKDNPWVWVLEFRRTECPK